MFTPKIVLGVVGLMLLVVSCAPAPTPAPTAAPPTMAATLVPTAAPATLAATPAIEASQIIYQEQSARLKEIMADADYSTLMSWIRSAPVSVKCLSIVYGWEWSGKVVASTNAAKTCGDNLNSIMSVASKYVHPIAASFSASVVSLKFFESGYDMPALGQRVYDSQFDGKTSRFIDWEIFLVGPAPGQRVDFSVHSVYLRSDGSVYAEFDDSASLTPDWSGLISAGGWGSKEPGSWSNGTYTVVLSIEGNEITRGSFTVRSGAGSSLSPTQVILAQPSSTSNALAPSSTTAAVPVPAGLFVGNVRLEPDQPKHNDVITFFVTFLNTTGAVQNYRWRVYIYKADTPSRTSSETTFLSSAITTGTTEDQSLGTFRYGASGNQCDYFFARVGWPDDQNNIHFFPAPNGQTAEKGFSVCNL